MTPSPRKPGGLIHAYLGYDPKKFGSPNQPPPDLASPAMEHMLRYGSLRGLSAEELASAVRIDPSQIAGLGPSLESLIRMLEERKRRILETYEARTVQDRALRAVRDRAGSMQPPPELADQFHAAVARDDLRALQRLWYRVEGTKDRFAADLLHLSERLGERFEVETLAAKYEFSGRTGLSVDEAIAVKDELETIDRLLEQLREAMKNAQIAVIDLDELSRFVDEASVDELSEMQRRVADYIREQAEQQGLEMGAEELRLSPRAYRIFQGALLDEIFSDLEASRSGRHAGPIEGEGPTELPSTRPYEFGDPVSSMDIPQSFINSLIREGAQPPGSPRRVRLRGDDIEIHRTKNNPKAATCLLMDMSGSMRSMGQYVSAKRMALGLDGLIRSEFPGDYLQCFEVYSVARPVHISEVASLMPKPVTIREPMVRLRADMSDPRITESMLPPHFTNIQHGLRLARQHLANQDTPNRQIMLITDGLPTAHFEDQTLFLLYPPDPLTERETMREAMACAREGITINVFLVPSWSQSHEDIQFAQRLAEATRGRVFFTAGDDLDRFVLWDYVKGKRAIIG
ncbi:MAG: hypothetical protein ACF8SC_01515 [Phycisphaerales bacterium JB037]